uniref:Uncharacterized protein n=1 Tax=viral metagenome TaxID=1070528 RepID=A0A6C0APZ3_9ZZZZ
MFEPGDKVVYNPCMDCLPPYNKRPWDIGIVIEADDCYAKVKFMDQYVNQILFMGLTHHPLSPKAHRQRLALVIPELLGAVEGRVAALVFSEKTGLTACRGLGPADDIRKFLDPRKPRKHITLIRTQETKC